MRRTSNVVVMVITVICVVLQQPELVHTVPPPLPSHRFLVLAIDITLRLRVLPTHLLPLMIVPPTPLIHITQIGLLLCSRGSKGVITARPPRQDGGVGRGYLSRVEAHRVAYQGG